ncbi:MAG: hypothetical protein Q9166_001490 [cf. Caloplaca sp. 2 TL-2023]
MEVANPFEFALDQMDDASAAFIVGLQREDVEELQRIYKGKGREGEISDAALAIETYQQELQQASAIWTDRCMSRSLARAVMADSAFLTDAVAREDAFANDRLVAERFANGDEIGCCTEGCSKGPKLDDLFIARLTALYVNARAEQVVARDQPHRPLPAAAQVLQVQEAVENLRNRHNLHLRVYAMPNKGLQQVQKE